MRRDWSVGERVRLWRHPDLKYPAGVITAGPRYGYQYDVLLDDGREVVDFPVGFIEDDWTDEQEERAVANARRAGFATGDGVRFTCDARTHSGLTGCSLRHIVDMYDHDLPDCECGAVIDKSRGETTRCFSCGFWLRLHREHADERLVVAGSDGVRRHYLDGGASSRPSSHSGFSGATFRWRMLADGTEHETNNMWGQGDIPERFHDLFPINAEMIT